MKALLILVLFSLLVPAYMGARLLRRAVDDLDSIANDSRLIRYQLCPSSAMRGRNSDPAPEKIDLPEGVWTL